MTLKVLITSRLAENVQTAQYVSPPGTRTVIDKFTVTNSTGSAVTFAVNLVTSGNAAGAENLVLPAKSIAAGAVEELYELVGHVLQAGDFISTIAGTDAALVIRASGRQFVG